MCFVSRRPRSGEFLCRKYIGPSSARVIAPRFFQTSPRDSFAITSRSSRCQEDLHLQAIEHARHTSKREGLAAFPWANESEMFSWFRSGTARQFVWCAEHSPAPLQ